jgi:hypothetical membrane protein
MHVLEPEFSPVRTPMSAYPLGAYGGWMTTTYVMLSAALLCVGYGLATTLAPTRLKRSALSILLIAAVAALLAGIFPMDFPGPPHTSSSRLHALSGALTFPTWVLGVFLFSLSARAIGIGEVSRAGCWCFRQSSSGCLRLRSFHCCFLALPPTRSVCWSPCSSPG